MLKHAQLWLSSIAIAALMAGASAQTWDETANGGGDAGDLPASAQVVSGNPNDPLTKITGSISTTDIADLYQIIICDPANFYAHTGTTSETTFDTRLVLFDSQGKPLWTNDDHPTAVSATPPNGIGSLRSYIGGGAAADDYRSSDTPYAAGSATWGLPGPGIYYLAISHWAVNPLNAASEDLFWDTSPYASIYKPYAARANDVLAQWDGSSTSGTYTIHLQGACFVPEPASMIALGAGLAGLLGLRRRKQ